MNIAQASGKKEITLWDAYIVYMILVGWPLAVKDSPQRRSPLWYIYAGGFWPWVGDAAIHALSDTWEPGQYQGAGSHNSTQPMCISSENQTFEKKRNVNHMKLPFCISKSEKSANF